MRLARRREGCHRAERERHALHAERRRDDRRGETLVGESAKNQAYINPENTIAGVKRSSVREPGCRWVAMYDPVEDVALEAVRRAVALLGSRQAEGEVAALYGRSKAFLRARILELALATGEELFRSTIRIAATDEDPVLRAMAARSSLA